MPPDTGTNLVTLLGGLPKVGEPGNTLGGRVMPGYGFPAKEGGAPIQGAAPPQPTLASQSAPEGGYEGALARGERTYRARCVGCHQVGGASGPNLFRNRLVPSRYLDAVSKGRPGTAMAAFDSVLSVDEIWELWAFVQSRDRLE